MIKSKRILWIILALTVALTATIGVGLIASAEEQSVFAENDYALSSTVAVRLAYDNQGLLNKTKNGIRCKTALPKSQFEELQKLNNGPTEVKFGVLLAPAESVGEYPLTEANVFGENRVYATSAVQQANDLANGKNTILLKTAETADMTKGADDYYAYFYFSNFDSENIMRNYVAKAYIVKYSYDQYGMAVCEYNFASGEKQINVVNLAQKAVENGGVDEYSDDLQSTYIAGKNGEIEVEYITSYDGAAPISKTVSLPFAIGSVVTKQNILDAINSEVEQSAFDLTTSFESAKIYAGVKQSVEFNFSAKKAESNTAALGLYVAGENTVQITQNGITCGELVNAPFTLFCDGTITIDGDGGKEVFGNVNIRERKFVLDGVELSQLVELNEDIYNKVSGLYNFDGKVVMLNNDSTAIFDVLGGGIKEKYLLTYDETSGNCFAVFSNSIIKTLTIGETCRIEDFEPAKLANQSAYEGVAEYYNCTVNGNEKVYKFNIDGSIVENGEQVGNFMLFDDGSTKVVLNDNVYDAAININNYNFGLVCSIITLNDSSGAVAATLTNNNLLSGNDYLFDRLGSLFGYNELVFVGKEVEKDAKGYPTREAGVPKLTLTTSDTEAEALQNELTPDGKKLWKNAEFGTTKWDSKLVRTAGKRLLSYYIEPKTASTGLIHFKKHIIETQEPVTHKFASVAYRINEQYQFIVDFTNYDPHGLGDYGQYQMLTADITEKTAGSYVGESSVYNIFATASGTYYYPTDHRDAGATSSQGYPRLYNFHTENEEFSSEYYTCEIWSPINTKIQPGYERDKIGYKIEFDNSKKIGKLTIVRFRDKKQFTYIIGTVNGVNFIDMRSPSIAGYKPFDNLKVSDPNPSQSILNAIEYAIANADGSSGTAGGTTEPSVDTRTIYEKMAGTYKSRNYYGETEKWWYGIGFTLNADRTFKMTNGLNSENATYEIEEVTDNFGIIRIDCPYALTKRKGIVYDGYYAFIDGQYVFRITNCAMCAQKWSFWDFVADGCTFSTWDVFDDVVGEGTTYSDGNATLTLDKLGGKPTKPDGGTDNYYGGNFTLVDGEVTLSGNYDFVPTAHGEGKLFMHFTSLPAESGYIIGEYELIGDSYALVFTVNSKSYLMGVGGLEPLYSLVKGEYFGVEQTSISDRAAITFTSMSMGTIAQDGIVFEFVIKDDIVKLTYRKNGLDYVAMKH